MNDKGHDNFIIFMTVSIRFAFLFITVLASLGTSGSLFAESTQENTSIIVKDDLGNTTSRLQFFTHDSTIRYVFSSDSPSCTFKFAPQLPSYLVLSQPSGQLITTAEATPMEATVFTVSCESGEGSTEVTIEVQACSGDNAYSSYMESSSATVVLKRQTVLREFVLTPDIQAVCFPSDAFEMTMTCSRPPCVIGFTASDNLLLVHERIIDFQPLTITFDPHTSDAIVLSEVPDSYFLVPDQPFQFSVPIEGSFYPVAFNPPLPQGVSWDPYSQVFKVQMAQGVYTITITVSNRKESVTKELLLNVGTCHENYEMMGVHMRSRNYDDLVIRNDANKMVFSESLEVATSDFTLCLPRGEYLVNVTRRMKSYLEEDYDINFTDSDGDIIETIIRTKETPQILKRLTVGDFVPFGSPLRFTQAASVEPAWVEKKYKDKSWREGTSGNWGSFTEAAPVAYFRKQFSLSDLSPISIVHVAIRARGNAVVYLNGKEISQSTLSERTTSRTTLPASFLAKGTNVVCVQLQDSPSQSIEFDLSVHLSRSLSLPRRYSGVSSDEPKQEEEETNAAKAFDEDTTKEWHSVAVPVTLTYLFSVPHHSWINRIQFRTTERLASGLAVDFTIQGLVVKKQGSETSIVQTEEIGHIVDANFGYLRYVYNYDFVPTRTYDGFRFIVHKGYSSSWATLGSISFHVASPQMCKRKWFYGSIPVGTSKTGRCSLSSVGTRVMRCEQDEDGKAVWVRDDSMCVVRYPSKGVSFVDTEVQMTAVPEWGVSHVSSQLSSVITGLLTVFSEQISYPVAVALDATGTNREMMMRFTVEEEIGDYVVKKMKESMKDIEEGSQMHFSRPSEIKISPSPKYRYPFPWRVIILIVVSVVAVIVYSYLLLFCYRQSLRSKQVAGLTPTVKQLKKTGGNERESLLLCVCYEITIEFVLRKTLLQQTPQQIALNVNRHEPWAGWA